MNLYVLDFETYYADDYTLSKMTNESYIRDPRFYAHGCGLLSADTTYAAYAHHDQLPEFFESIDWSQTGIICHHAQFDAAILNWIYGERPAFIVDTLSMARALFPGSSISLDNLCKKLGIEHNGGGKGELNTKNLLGLSQPYIEGKRYITLEEAQACGSYCIQDCHLTLKLYQAMVQYFPISELRLIDMTVRMYSEPILQLNKPLLEEALAEEFEIKRVLMEKIGSNRQELGSNACFAYMLEQAGVIPPVKLSPAALKRGEEEWVYAFAKSDEEFIALLEHEDPTVVALVEARLGVKSTTKETRTQRMIGIAERGNLPIYYNYYGGHTGRFSGGDKMNPQNFTRKSKQRLAIEAPPGCVLVVRDSSQIEARHLALFAGQWDIVEAFEQNRDVYSEMATVIFGRKVDRKNVEADFIPGFIGKAVVLGCGYGLGWKKFQAMIRVGMLGMKGITFGIQMAEELGVNLIQFNAKYGKDVQATLPFNTTYENHLIHCAVAKKIIDTFRNNNKYIVDSWKQAQEALPYMVDPDFKDYIPLGAGEPIVYAAHECIWLPNGMRLVYPHLRKSGKDGYEIMKVKGRKKEVSKVYGGLMIENIIQALARIAITDAMLQCKAEGMQVVMMTHDEIVVCCRESDAEYVYNRMGEIMSARPAWAPSIPLTSEGGYARNYSK